MQNKTNEIINPIAAAVEQFNKADPKLEDAGTVIEVKDGVVLVNGLTSVQFNELVSFPGGESGIAFNLEPDSVGVVVLGDYSKIRSGQVVTRTKQILSVNVSEETIGRVVDAQANGIDGLGKIKSGKQMKIERIAPGVMTRQSVSQPMQTGIKVIDALIPIGRGQRQLIIGDRQTGKSTIALDTILNQHDQNMICVYVSVGQKRAKLAQTVNVLKEKGALDYTVVVAATASEPAPNLYLAPYTGTAIAEYFAEQGKDVLVIYDDLTKQANAYREMSLLLRRPPGREAFPGDVFYLHSRLLERAVKYNEKYGNGSITALPIIETQAGDVSAYIPTNVISITDGQIFLEGDLFYKGVRPAVNIGLSVSRVGSAAQLKSMKKVAGKLKLQHAQFRELEAFSQFSSDMDEATRKTLDRGRRLNEVIKQPLASPVPVGEQVAVIYATSQGMFDEIPESAIKRIETDIREFMVNVHSKLLAKLAEGKWSDEVEAELKQAIKNFLNEGGYISDKNTDQE